MLYPEEFYNCADVSITSSECKLTTILHEQYVWLYVFTYGTGTAPTPACVSEKADRSNKIEIEPNA